MAHLRRKIYCLRSNYSAIKSNYSPRMALTEIELRVSSGASIRVAPNIFYRTPILRKRE